MKLLIVVVLLCAAASPTFASPDPTVYRLTDTEKNAIAAAASRAGPEQAPLVEKPRRAIHGEVGVAIGTGGYSSLYGTAIMPVGDEGYAALSVETTRFGGLRNGRYR